MRQSDIDDAANRPIVRALLVLEEAVNALEIAAELNLTTTTTLDADAIECTLRDFSEKNADAAFFLRKDIDLDEVLDVLYGDWYSAKDIRLPNAERAVYALARHRAMILDAPRRFLCLYLRLGGSSIEVLSWFVEHGSNFDPIEDAMHLAAENGNLEIVRFLVKRGANIRANDGGALRSAAANGHLDMVRWLVDCGADVHARDHSAVRWAAENGRLEVVRFLIERGANFRFWDDLAMRSAVTNGHLDVVRLLVECGADIHAGNDYAMRYAVAKGHLNLIKFLGEHGADIHADDNYVM